MGAVLDPRAPLDQHGHAPVGGRGRLLHGVRDPGPRGGREAHPIDDEVHRLRLIEGERLGVEAVLLSVHHDPHEPGGSPAGHEGPQPVSERLPSGPQVDRVAVHRGEDPPLGLPVQLPRRLEDLTGHLARIRGAQGLAVVGAASLARASVEDPQLVMNLGGRGHRRAGVPPHRGGLHCDGGAEPLDALDRRLVLGTEELTRVGGE